MPLARCRPQPQHGSGTGGLRGGRGQGCRVFRKARSRSVPCRSILAGMRVQAWARRRTVHRNASPVRFEKNALKGRRLR